MSDVCLPSVAELCRRRPAILGDVTTAAVRRPGRPRKSEQARADERARLLAEARAAIRSRGADVSVEELAAAAGVSKPVLYAHFADKAGLAEALAVDVAGTLEAQVLGRAGAIGPDVAGLLRAAVDAFTRFVADEPHVYRFIVRSMKASDADVLDNALVRALSARTAAVLEVALPHVEREQREIAAFALLGQVFGAAEAWQQHRRVSRRKLVDTLVALSLAGFQGLGEA